MLRNITNQLAKSTDKNNDLVFNENAAGFHQKTAVVACAHMSPKIPRKSCIPQFIRTHEAMKTKAAKLQSHEEIKNVESFKATKPSPRAQRQTETKCQRSRSCGGHSASFSAQNSPKNVKHPKGKTTDLRSDLFKSNNREVKVAKMALVVPKLLYKAPATPASGYRCSSAGGQINKPTVEKRAVNIESKHNFKSTLCDTSTNQRMDSADSSNTYRVPTPCDTASDTQVNEDIQLVSHLSPPSTTYEQSEEASNDKRNLDVRSSPSSLKTKLRLDLKVLYAEKKKRFEIMQSELKDKQKKAKELHNSLQEMRDKIKLANAQKNDVRKDDNSSSNKNEAVTGTLNSSDVKKDSDNAQKGSKETFTNEEESENFSTTIADKLYEIPTSILTLCELALCKRHHILKWLQSLLCNNGKVIKSEDFSNKLNELMAESDELAMSYNEAMSQLYRGIRNTLDLLKKADLDRDQVRDRTESLSLEIAELRHMNDLLQQQFIASTGDQPALIRADGVQIEHLEKELADERDRREVIGDRLQMAEIQLKTKNDELKQIMLILEKAEMEKSFLTKAIKDIKEDNKNVKTEYEAQIEVTTGSLKTNLEKLNTINSHVSELEQIVSTQALQLTSLSDTVNRLEEENCNLRKKSEYYETKVSNMDGLIHDREMQIQQLLEKLEKQADSKEEMKNELIKSTELLKLLQEQNEAYKMDKQKLMDKRFSEREVQTDINAEASAKWLSYDAMLTEKDQRILHYEKQLKELQNVISQLGVTDADYKSGSFPELKEVVINQKNKLVSITQHNGQLASDLMDKNKLIEKYQQSLGEQSALLQMKEEVIEMLSSKDAEQSSAIQYLHQNIEIKEKVENELKRKIKEKSDEMEKLNSNLETRKIQTDHLERLVMALESQNHQNRLNRRKDRERIADLERLVSEAVKHSSPHLDVDKLLTLMEFELENDDIDSKRMTEGSLINEPPVLERKHSFNNTNMPYRSRNKMLFSELLTAPKHKNPASSLESMNYGSNHSFRMSDNNRKYCYSDRYRMVFGTNHLDNVSLCHDNNHALGMAEVNGVKPNFMMSKPR